MLPLSWEFLPYDSPEDLHLCRGEVAALALGVHIGHIKCLLLRSVLDSLHAHGTEPIRRGPIADLPGGVVAPAVRRTRGRDPAGVSDAGAYPSEAEPPADRHGVHRRCRAPVPDLAVAIFPPAVRRARGRDAAGVKPRRARRGESEATQDGHRARPLGRGSVAELTVVISTPAVRRARGRDAAGVI